MHKISLLIAGLIISGSSLCAQTTSIVSGKTDFTIKALYGNVDGTFHTPTGKVIFDQVNLKKSEIDISVSTASFFTGNSKRDQHMVKALTL